MANKKRKQSRQKRTAVSKPTKIKLSHEDRLWIAQALRQAIAMMQQGQTGRAAQIYEQVLSKDPGNVEALEQLGLILTQARQLEPARKMLQLAVEQDPKRVRSWYMLACVYVETKDEEAAIEAYKRAIALKPDLVEAHNNLGVIYKNREQFELAAECFQVVVRLDPKSSYALSNLGNVLKDAGYMDKAIKTLKRAIESDNYLASAYSNLLMALNYLPELTPEEFFQQHQEWGSHVPVSILPERFELSERRTKLAKKEKLRLGFVSPDLHMHSVAYFVDAIFSSLDRNRFELFVYYNNDRHDAVQQRFQEQADAWFDVKELNEESLANKVYQDEIDVLFDLAGHTANNRLALFYQKPAPIQVSWLGYPNTSGLSQIDYRLVDAITDPVGIADDCHSETLFRLPGCFLCYSPMLSESEQSQLTVVQTPSMKNGYVTFGSFNNLVKVTDAVIETWAKVLLSVEHSKLLIKSRQLGNSMTRARVIKRFEAQGVSKDRLLLHEMVPDRLAHLNLYNEIDIALDTFPYNGTTTTCEALWMGVPTLTLEGKMHASRVGSSLLQSVGIGEFVAASPDEFVSKAVSFCADLKALDELRQSLRSNLMSSRLCSPAPYVDSFQSFINEICTKA